MPLVRLGPHESNPFSEPHAGWLVRIPSLRADMPYLRDGNINRATTRLTNTVANVVPTPSSCKILKTHRISESLGHNSLEICSQSPRLIQVLGEPARIVRHYDGDGTPNYVRRSYYKDYVFIRLQELRDGWDSRPDHGCDRTRGHSLLCWQLQRNLFRNGLRRHLSAGSNVGCEGTGRDESHVSRTSNSV